METIENCNKFRKLELILVPLTTPTLYLPLQYAGYSIALLTTSLPSAIFSTILLRSIAGSNIFLSPERDKEMKINDKISSQSIKQNEQRTHGANQINLFLKSNPFSALAPHALSCTPLSPPPADYTLSLSLSCGPHI